MPQITKSVAKDHLFNAVKKYAELTGGLLLPTRKVVLLLLESSLSKTTSKNIGEQLSG